MLITAVVVSWMAVNFGFILAGRKPLDESPFFWMQGTVALAVIVKRSDAKGFIVLPKRWIVERTIAWLSRCRRLAKDWENLNRKALAFLRLASIRLMLRKLCNPA